MVAFMSREPEKVGQGGPGKSQETTKTSAFLTIKICENCFVKSPWLRQTFLTVVELNVAAQGAQGSFGDIFRGFAPITKCFSLNHFFGHKFFTSRAKIAFYGSGVIEATNF